MAQETLQITSVRVQNYRSIVDEQFNAGRLNLFVGLNDVGKSNILRALDLFFNGPNAASPFVFTRDFCKHTKTPVNKAKESRVTLTLKLPASYDAAEIHWKKVWRVSGPYEPGTELHHVDKTPLKARSRVPALLNSIRFEYVPAVKGNDYFETLLKALHDVLVDTVADDIRLASGGFTSTINDKTRSALDEIESKLGIKSTIELPSDLRELFSRLEFQSQGKMAVSLSQRGDGVKARHIPILLHYIAQQSRSRRVKGSPQSQTIWGFEEPENNLEMSKAVDLAREFVDYSQEIQIFATTHSPAFYSLGTSVPDTSIFLVTGTGADGNTVVKPVKAGEFEAVDEHVGILPIIAPSFARAVAERDKSLAMLDEVKKLDRPTIFVEGENDAFVLERAFGLFAPHVLTQVTIRSERSAGANWVKDMLLAWAHGRVAHKALGICDSDEAGTQARQEVNENPRVQSANHVSNKDGKKQHIKVLQLHPNSALLPIFQKGLKLPVALEELFPVSVWRHAEAQGWLVKRNDIVPLNEFTALDTTFEEYCRSKGATEDELLLLTKCVPMEMKAKFSRYVCKLTGQACSDAFVAFEELVRKVEKFFGANASSTTTDSNTTQ
jgi:hypothetical protein